MKTTLITFTLIISICNSLLCQIKDYFTNPSKKITIGLIDSSATSLDKESDINNFIKIASGDVFEYYNLSDTYDTELKKENYKQTSEYKTQLADLQKMQKELFSMYYYLHFNYNSADNEKMFTDGGDGGSGKLTYDIQKGGFWVNLGAVDKIFKGCPYVYRKNFEFKAIPVIKGKVIDMENIATWGTWVDNPNFYRQLAFLIMDKTTGLKVENNLESLNLMALFKATSIENRQVQYFGRAWIIPVIKTNSVKLILYNKLTNEIYYDKTYTLY